MPVAAYSAWQNLGRPLSPAQPIRELVAALKAAYPAAAWQNLFSWYADDAHYAAVPAEDHTPFSQTGWPDVSPQWYVFATDVMHRPDLGVDCNVLFVYWLSEARAGRMPWLKYMIWQGRLYDVRRGWVPVGNSGHFDHIHLSARTDFVNIGLGGWSPIPGGPDMDAAQDAKLTEIWLRMHATDQRVREALLMGATVMDDVPGEGPGHPVGINVRLQEILAAVAAPVPVQVDASAVATALAADPAFRDAVAGVVRAELNKTRLAG